MSEPCRNCGKPIFQVSPLWWWHVDSRGPYCEPKGITQASPFHTNEFSGNTYASKEEFDKAVGKSGLV